MKSRTEAKEVFSVIFAPGSHFLQPTSSGRGMIDGVDVFIGKTINERKTRVDRTGARKLLSPCELCHVSLSEMLDCLENLPYCFLFNRINIRWTHQYFRYPCMNYKSISSFSDSYEVNNFDTTYQPNCHRLLQITLENSPRYRRYHKNILDIIIISKLSKELKIIRSINGNI